MQRAGHPDLHGSASSLFLPDDGDSAVPGRVRAERDRVFRGSRGRLHGNAKLPDNLGVDDDR